MNNLTPPQQDRLREIFGEHASFDLQERRAYGHTAGTVPPLAQPLVGDTTPSAVVQPTTREQVIALVHFANEAQVPLTPRGRATSGFGGPTPIHGGIVVDFSLMRRILDIQPDGENYTVTVEPGITWQDLDEELNEIGLSLRLYPTSAPTSTVGGWLAQGGAGIGSYEFGYFSDNVTKASVVLPDGSTRDFGGDDLKYISDVEGITGLIYSVVFRVRLQDEIVVQAYEFTTAGDLQIALREIYSAELPIWSLTFIDPTMARLKNEVPLEKHHGVVVEPDRPLLSQCYLASIAYPASRQSEIEPVLAYLIEPLGARTTRRVAEHEWCERFNPLRLKYLGPALVPAQVVLPRDRFAEFVYRLREKVEVPIAFEGTVIKGTEIAVLGFVPNEGQKIDFNAAFALSMNMINTAKDLGGHAYSTGLYFTRERDSALGKARVDDLELFKATWDQNNIMNPNKVITHNAVNWAITLSSTGEMFARTQFARLLRSVSFK